MHVITYVYEVTKLSDIKFLPIFIPLMRVIPASPAHMNRPLGYESVRLCVQWVCILMHCGIGHVSARI